jgi:hypothetical protein
VTKALIRAVRRGDVDAVVESIEGASEKERRAAAPKFVAHGVPERDAASLLAWLGTTTAREVSTWWFLLDELPLEPTLRIVRARGAAFLATLVRAFERDTLMLWPLVRGAIRAGLIERPDPDSYARAVATAVGGHARFWELDATYRELLADPELLADDVWLLFEFDAGRELANAHTYGPGDGGGVGKIAGNRWLYAFTRLAEEGRLDRVRLLDASLAALQRDFRASTVGWYAKLHEALAPTPAERAARLETYLALLASPAPAVVKCGVTGLRAVEERVPADALARAARPALTVRQKGIALDVLRLLARAAERGPEHRPELLMTAAEALAHERTDVQERALAVLEAHAQELDERVRATLLGLGEVVATPLRPRVEALSGIAVASPGAPAPMKAS